MKNRYLRIFSYAILSLIGLLPTNLMAQTVFSKESAKVVWDFTSSSTVAPSTVTPTDGFTLTTASAGSDLKEGKASFNGVNYVSFQPATQVSSAQEADAVSWKVVPTKGLTFIPTHVQAKMMRCGTDGGSIDVVAETADGKKSVLGTSIKPMRNKAGNTDPSSFSFDVSDSMATSSGFILVAYIHDLGITKQICFSDVEIAGTVSGTTVVVTKYSLNAAPSSDAAGTVSINPAGGTYDEGTEVTLSAEKKFGYKFVNWTNSAGTVVSTDPKFKFTLNANTSLTANFAKVNTYALAVNVTSPAVDYMVGWNPSPTVVNNKNMYEEGTVVTLTANSNNIISFTGWSNGETASAITVDMTADQALTANYDATSYIAAWDFWQKGSDGRVADFASADNDADQLVFRMADGTASSWLDKSEMNGGYEGRPAAVNWRTGSSNGDVGNYYWQTKVNASAFTNIKVISSMMYNYNAYTHQNVDFSFDGVNWTTIGTFVLPAPKSWTDSTFILPNSCNNKSVIYLRWISNKTSAVDGTASVNDGIALGGVYITGTEAMVNDGTAPVLISSVPAQGSTTASANGKVVLTFDEKVKVASGAVATLGNKSIPASVSGKSIIFEYTGLEYAKTYKFELPANSVSDLTDNYIKTAIILNFTTKTKPAIVKALYDFVVPDDGTFKDAVSAAAKRADTSKRYRIFVKKGTYQIPADQTSSVVGSDKKSYPDPKTYITVPNISIIGEDMSSTVILNTPPVTAYGVANPIEGLRNCDVIQIADAGKNTYFQDITLKNNTPDATGRNCALTDQSDKTICKDVCLYGYQDTYLSNNANGRFYFEGGQLRGRTDFLCGKGDVYYNGCDLVVCQAGGYIAVPSQAKQYGYIFNGCTIKAEQGTTGINGNFTLGRPWGTGTPIDIYINTVMEVQPSAIGWSEMTNGYPARFAEYNSVTSSGSVVDLSGRKVTFNGTYTNKPTLTADEASAYTVATVMGSTDGWDPTAYTEQASAPENVVLNGKKISWSDNNYVLCWAVCLNGKVQSFTTEPTFNIESESNSDVWSVRAANEMGGLGDATVAKSADAPVPSSIDGVKTANRVVDTKFYTVSGSQISTPNRGVTIKVEINNDGTKNVSKLYIK